MESAFTTFLQLGYDHILDPDGIDHLLFVVALCATYRLAEWRQVAILVTAFTIGHSITLAMAATGVLTFSARIIELLIPITILITALYNIWMTYSGDQSVSHNRTNRSKYAIALLFGWIHGMAFSNFFKSTLFPGQEQELVRQLLAFNIGVELGQLLIVAIVLGISTIAMSIFRVKQQYWSYFISILVVFASFYLFSQLV